MIKFELDRSRCTRSGVPSMPVYYFKLKESIKLINNYNKNEIDIDCIYYDKPFNCIMLMDGIRRHSISKFNIEELDMEHLKEQLKIGIKVADMKAELEVRKMKMGRLRK